MTEFKTVVWPILAESCATSQCHGGANAGGRLRLFNAQLDDPRILYTNFYILHALSENGLKMLDRANKEDSLLLQYGLPRDIAKAPHPEKMRIEPVFRTSPWRLHCSSRN